MSPCFTKDKNIKQPNNLHLGRKYSAPGDCDATLWTHTNSRPTVPTGTLKFSNSSKLWGVIWIQTGHMCEKILHEHRQLIQQFGLLLKFSALERSRTDWAFLDYMHKSLVCYKEWGRLPQSLLGVWLPCKPFLVDLTSDSALDRLCRTMAIFTHPQYCIASNQRILWNEDPKGMFQKKNKDIKHFFQYLFVQGYKIHEEVLVTISQLINCPWGGCDVASGVSSFLMIVASGTCEREGHQRLPWKKSWLWQWWVTCQNTI